MQVSIEEKKDPNVFNPFTLKIKIETADDLLTMWHRFNINFTHVARDADEILPKTETDTHNIWEILNTKAEEQSLL